MPRWCSDRTAGRSRTTARSIFFDVDAPGGTSYRESNSVVARQGHRDPTISATSPVGCSICYDIRFPELFRKLRDAGGRRDRVAGGFHADAGKDHWELLARAAAAAETRRPGPRLGADRHACGRQEGLLRPLDGD